ncbi:MAG: small multi-drug export protein [Planctomycetota bacterium]
MYHVAILVLISILPITELRASIPLGLFAYRELPAWAVITVCTLANIAVGPVVYLAIGGIIRLARRMPRLDRFYMRYQERVGKRLKPHVDRYGTTGLAIFIAVPLPGSGVYSAAIGAQALEMDFKRFMIAAVFGVIGAGILVTLVTYGVMSGVEWLGFFIKRPV